MNWIRIKFVRRIVGKLNSYFEKFFNLVIVKQIYSSFDQHWVYLWSRRGTSVEKSVLHWAITDRVTSKAMQCLSFNAHPALKFMLTMGQDLEFDVSPELVHSVISDVKCPLCSCGIVFLWMSALRSRSHSIGCFFLFTWKPYPALYDIVMEKPTGSKSYNPLLPTCEVQTGYR